MSVLNEDINGAFFSNKKKSQKQKTLDKYGVKDYKPTKSGAMPMYGLGAFDDVDTKEIEKRLTKAFGASMSNNTIKAQSNRAIKSFPLICSDAISSELVYTFKNIFEENYAQFISLLVSNQVVDLGEYETTKDSGNVAIQVLDDLSSTDLKKTRLMQKAAQTGSIATDDFLGSAGALLGFTEDMHTGNAVLDTLLEDAMICEAANAPYIEEALAESLNEARQAYNMVGAPDRKRPERSTPDYIYATDTNPVGDDIAKFMNYTVANELSEQTEYMRGMKEDFLIAAKLMAAHKIAGTEFLAYCYHLGIPVPKQVGYTILNRFKIGDVRFMQNTNYSLNDIYAEARRRASGSTAPSTLGAGSILTKTDFTIGSKQVEAMLANRKVVTTYIDDIIGVNLKDIMYTFYKNKYIRDKLIAGGVFSGVGGAALAGGSIALGGATLATAGAAIGAAVIGGPILAGVGLALFVAGMIAHARRNKHNQRAANAAESAEYEIMDDIESVARSSGAGVNARIDVRFRRRWFKKMQDGYKRYLAALKESDPAKYDKILKQATKDGSGGYSATLGTFNPIQIYVPNKIIAKTSTPNGMGMKGFTVEHTSKPISRPNDTTVEIMGNENYTLGGKIEEWERVQTLVEMYKSQRKSTNLEELRSNFNKHPINNHYFEMVNSEIDDLLHNGTEDALRGMNDFLKGMQPMLEKADKEMDASFEQSFTRTKFQEACAANIHGDMLTEAAYDQAFEKNDYKAIALPLFEEYDMSTFGYDLPTDLIAEAHESGDEFLIALCEYMTVDEKRAQQAEIQKIMTAMPMKKYEYDSIKGKTVVAPAFAGSRELVYGSVEYDTKAQEKRRFGTPLMLKITFRKRFDDGKFADNDLVAYIGILAEIITIPSEEMEYILEKNAEGSTIKNFFTGKISAKDAISDIFGVAKIKDDVKHLPVSADVWKNLEAVSRRVIANKLAGKSSGNLSNAHFLFSDTEVANLRNRTNIDYYRDKKLAQSLMERYSAFTFAIINESTERVYMLDDPAAISYQIIPLSVLRGANTTDSMISAISALQGRRI